MSLVALLEYGYHGFGGYGKRYFTASHHSDIAYLIRRLDIPKVAKDAVTDFFCYAFERDNRNFSKAKFLSQVAHSRGEFQQRHYYYLAECIKHQPEHFREYLATLLGDMFSRRGNFRESLWYRECHVKEDS